MTEEILAGAMPDQPVGETPTPTAGVMPEQADTTAPEDANEARETTDEPTEPDDGGETPPTDSAPLQAAIDRERERIKTLRAQIHAAQMANDEAHAEGRRLWTASRRCVAVALAGVGQELTALFGNDFSEDYAASVARAVRAEVARRTSSGPLPIRGTPPAIQKAHDLLHKDSVPSFR